MKNKNVVEFWPRYSGLTKIPEIKPYRLNTNLPNWWKDMPYIKKTIKTCPGALDIFSSAYVLPSWVDAEINIVDRESKMYTWSSPLEEFLFEEHDDGQFLHYAPDKLKEKTVGILKYVSPWFMKTPKGYSSLQMPAYYDFNQDFSVPIGVVDTDIYHEINAQLILSSEKDVIKISRGQPIAYFFPFKRDTFSLNVRERNEEDKINENKTKYSSLTKFFGGYISYRRSLEKD